MTELSLTTTIGYDDGDVDTNASRNLHLNDIVQQRYSRRQTLFGGLSAMTTAAFGSVLLSACGGDELDDPGVVVSAGESITTSAGKTVTLNGIAGNNATTSGFTQVSGPTVTLSTAGGVTTFVAPAVAAATALVFRFSASGKNGQTSSADTTVTVNPATLAFAAVAKNLNDIVTVPEGYSVAVLYRLGDPIAAGVSVYGNDGQDTNFAQRAGDQHDGMSFFGLAASGNTPDAMNNSRGILALNHENIVPAYMHANGPTTVAGRRPEAEAIKEIEAHGVSTIEVTRASGGAWSYVQASALNRRITPNTPMVFNGPVRSCAAPRTGPLNTIGVLGVMRRLSVDA